MISPVKIWRRQKETRILLGKKGKILSWTKIFVPGKDFKKYAPYSVVMVEFSDGQRSVGQLVDNPGEPKIGDTATTVLRKVREGSEDGVIAYGIKFKLL